MKNQWKDPLKRKEMTEGIKRYSLSSKGKATRSNNLHNTLLKLWENPEYYKTQQYKAQKQMIKNLNDPNFNHYHRVKYNGINFRSKLEVNFAKLFDELNIKYEYESIRLTYKDNKTNFNRIYILDFYLPQYNCIIEIKPKCFIETLFNGKFQCANNSKYNYIILTENDLSTDKILEKLPTIDERA